LKRPQLIVDLKGIMNLESLNAFTDLVILDISKTKTEEEEITDEFAFLE